MFERRVRTMVLNNCDDKEYRGVKRSSYEVDGALKGRRSFFATKRGEQSIRYSAQDETPLKAEVRQQRETCNQWTNCCPRRVEQGRDSSAVHPVFHARLDKDNDGREQDPRQK